MFFGYMFHFSRPPSLGASVVRSGTCLLSAGGQENGALPKSVNSYHDFGLQKCPDGYEILAVAEDGSVEAIKHTKLHWEGWMWHPERELVFSPRDIARLKGLFE